MLQFMKIKFLTLFLIVIGFTSFSFGQESENATKKIHVSGSAGITNNGISLIPNFSLGDPAALFNLSVSKGRLSFVTDFNFSLEAKPWYILYWLKYQLADSKKFKMTTGTHLGLNFISSELKIDDQPKKFLQYERYWVIDLSPTYVLTDNINLGVYYLHSRGLDPGTVGATHFLTLNANVTNIKLMKDVVLGINPQVYYLKQDNPHGFYFTSTFTLSKDNCPISISSLINKEIKTDITAGKDFVWNISIKYSFSK